jgi:hypothetical protein
LDLGILAAPKNEFHNFFVFWREFFWRKIVFCFVLLWKKRDCNFVASSLIPPAENNLSQDEFGQSWISSAVVKRLT